jgi:precorrin-2/cobalt-factor-2 C20-methyltransferase
MVENYGMPDEKIYYGVQSMPDEAGYFTVVIVT